MSKEQVCANLDLALQRLNVQGSVAILAGPATLTIKLRNGTYKNKAFNGGTQFVPTGCYLGKRGNIIYTLRPVLPSDFSLVELPEGKEAAFEGFEGTIRSLMKDIVGEEILPSEVGDIDVRQQVQVTQEQRVAAQVALEQNPLFGTW